MGLNNKIAEMLHDSVVDIFATIQEQEGIQFGDCPIAIEISLDDKVAELADVITKAVKYQKEACK